MIHSVQEVFTDESYHGKEVTARCTVTGEPKSGQEGGNKTLYPIRLPEADEGVFLSIWHDPPSWTDSFGETAQVVQEAVNDVPLQRGEPVLVRGIPNIHRGKWYLNTTELVIRDPDTSIGKSEMRSANECPRIYNLRFEKNVYSPGRYDFSPGSVKGRIVHALVETAVEEGFEERFERGWSEAEVESYLVELIEQQYTIEMALCRLAWVSPNRIKEHALEAATQLLTDEEFTTRIADAEDLSVEIGLSPAIGFNGRVDLVLDGTPYDLKTNYFLDEQKRKQHRFQLKLYLLAFALESLDPGERLSSRVDAGIEGYLVYPSLSNETEVVLEEVQLEQADIEDILSLRNEAVVLRDGFGIPTTYGRNCQGCSFKSATTDANDQEILPAPCQFYCQSERRWQCFERDEDDNIITQCPLFDECEQRLEFRDPAVTDHYTQLRQSLNTERQQRRNLGYELDRLEPETLSQAGLRVPELSLEALEGQQRLIFSSDAEIVPSFSPGAGVRLKQTGTEYHQEATFYGQICGNYVFQLETKPNAAFLDPTATFEAVRTIAADTLPRDLLSQLDYAQRGKVSPLLEATGEAGDAVVTVDADAIDEVTEYTDNKELYLDVPIRGDRNELVAEAVSAMATEKYVSPEREPIPEEDQRVLVLSARPPTTDILEERLASDSDAVRMDGFAGGAAESVSAMADGHQIYEALRDTSVIISSIRYALTENVFHAMREGDESVRQHTDRFFDTVILVGAETLVEPQYHFLSILGDRTIAVGDTRRSGSEMVSGEAREARLDEPYFNRLYRRFANIENKDSQSVKVDGEVTEPMRTAFGGLEWTPEMVDGEFEFVDTEGSAATAIGETRLKYSVPPANEESDTRFIRLSPVDRVDALQITQALQNLRDLDASSLTIKETYTIQDIRFEVRTSNPIDGNDHQLEINVPVHSTPYLHRRLTQNEEEARTVAEVCSNQNPDFIVTPFAAHANVVRDALSGNDAEVPVRLPSQLSGTRVDAAVVSLAVTGEERIVTPPVSEIETLYTVFNCADDVTLVGDRKTLERNSLIAQLLEG